MPEKLLSPPRVRADFNGLFGGILCLSHNETGVDESGAVIQFRPGLILTVFEEDVNESGERDDLVATGFVEQSPDWLKCKGSKWVLRINENGVRHESEICKVG